MKVMKMHFAILLIVIFALLLGCTQGDTTVSGTDIQGPGVQENRTIILNYQPVQCEQMPWAEYKTGTVTTKEAALIWLGKNGVFDAEIEEISNGVVCEACNVCPHYYWYAVSAEEKFGQKLRELGFGEFS